MTPAPLLLPALVTALLLAITVALLVPPGPRPPPRAGRAAGTSGRMRPALLRAAPVTALAALALGTPGRVLVLALVLGAAVWAAGGLRARRARRAAAAAAAQRVRETCEGLASDLAAGRPTGAALERACTVWTTLRPVAAAHAVGADVPAALRVLAAAPGCADLRLVAAAWTVAHRTGHGLADAVGRVADSLREAQATRRVVASELASARSTARVLAVLPLAALLMGTGAGGDPWRFLLTSEVGLACLAGGLALGLGGLWWIEALADDVEAGA